MRAKSKSKDLTVRSPGGLSHGARRAKPTSMAGVMAFFAARPRAARAGASPRPTSPKQNCEGLEPERRGSPLDICIFPKQTRHQYCKVAPKLHHPECDPMARPCPHGTALQAPARTSPKQDTGAFCLATVAQQDGVFNQTPGVLHGSAGVLPAKTTKNLRCQQRLPAPAENRTATPDCSCFKPLHVTFTEGPNEKILITTIDTNPGVCVLSCTVLF
jgi:hypothetical protein